MKLFQNNQIISVELKQQVEMVIAVDLKEPIEENNTAHVISNEHGKLSLKLIRI